MIVNVPYIKSVARFIRTQPSRYQGLDFYTLPDGSGGRALAPHMFPEKDHGDAIDFFFFMCMQNFGFWYGDDQGYRGALYGYQNGTRYKGSDLLTMSLKSYLDRWPDYGYGVPKRQSFLFAPRTLKDLSWEGFIKMFQTNRMFELDPGEVIPFPDLEERYKLTTSYARWFCDAATNPVGVVAAANRSREPLKAFIQLTSKIPGFNHDPLRKKNFLLAMALYNRPEKFLAVSDHYNWRPIVDYHLMRIALRLGLIVPNAEEVEWLKQRTWCSSRFEYNTRLFTYNAVKRLIRWSEKSMFEIDELLWSARRYCPEETTPNCDSCFFNPVCHKHVELFQPVYRTTNY